MEWLFIGTGILFILLAFTIFFGRTKKGERVKIIKVELVKLSKSLVKSIVDIAIIAIPLKLMAKDELSYLEIWIALAVLVLYYSIIMDIINFITYNYKFLTKKNK